MSNGDIRPCSDLRPLNHRTLLDTYPLPSIRSFLDKFKGARVFSRLDLKAAYYQIPVSTISSFKTVTLTPWGVYRYLRLPMGLKNPGQSFQKMVEAIFAGMTTVFTYIDDIMVWSRNLDDHYKTIQEVLTRLSANGLAKSENKCDFAKSKIEFLGYLEDENGIQPLPRKVDAIVNYPAPAKQKSLLGFLGAHNFYRRCLPNVDGQTPAAILQPLYSAATTKTTKKFTDIWAEQGLQKHFERAKHLLTLACQLTHPDPQAPLALTADASRWAAGAALEQLKNGVWRPIGFWSRHFPEPKQRWTTYRKETYAFQQGLRLFKD